MKSLTARISLCLLSILFLCCTFIFVAKMQNRKDDKARQQTPESIQSTRPDILWMRGGHQSAVYGMKFSPDGQKLVTSGLDGTVKVFRASDGILLRTFTRPDNSSLGYQYVPAIEVSPNSQTLAIGDVITSPSNAIVVYLYNINDGSLQRTASGFTSIGYFSTPYLSFAPDGNSLLVNKDIVSMTNGTIERTIPASINGQSPTVGVSYSPNGGRILVIANGQPYEVDSTSFSFIRNINSGTHYSPNGLYAFSGASVKRLSDLADITLTGSTSRDAYAAFSANGQYFAVSYQEIDQTRPSMVRVWNVSNSSTTWSLAYQFQPEGENSDGFLLFSPDSQYLATSKTVTSLWNASNGTFARGIGTLNSGELRSLAFSSNGQTLATITRAPFGGVYNQYGMLQLWNTADGSRRNINFSQSNSLQFLFDIGFADNNQKIITTETFNSTDNYIKVWNASDGSLIRNTQVVGSCGAGMGLAVAPDQQTYAVGGCPPIINIYNVSDGSVVRSFGSGSPISYSPNGQILATNSLENIYLYNVADGSFIRTLSGDSSEYVASESGAAFSPDGQTMAVIYRARNAGGPNSHIKLFRVSDGAVLQDFGTFNSIFGGSVAFSPDGQTVIGTGYDSTVRIWRVSDGALLQTYDQETTSGIQSRLFQVAYSPDGSRFAYGRYDATVVMARNTFNTNGTTNYTISGNITRNSSALSGVSVALSGSSSETTTTDASGNYSFTVAEGGSYTVTPTLAGNTFTPPSQTYNFISQNQTANFTAQLNTFTISGNVQSDGANLAGATVVLSGSQSATTTTDASGNYSFTANQGGNYTVTVSKNGYVFNPSSQTVTNLQSNTVVNFQSSSNAPLCAPAPSGLVGWWKGEGNALDSSGNSNGGTLENGTTFSTGKVGQGLNFDGVNDYVNIIDTVNSPGISINGAMTIQTWIKPDAVTLDQIIISKWQNNQASYFLELTNGNLRFLVSETGNNSNNFRAIITTGNPIVAGVFSHVVAKFNANNQEMQIFVNGIQVNTNIIGGSTTINSIFDSNVPVRLGVFDSGFLTQFFDGIIDEPQIYNRALSATEIQNIYNSGSAGVCSLSSFTGGGSLDTTFNSTGKVTTPIGTLHDEAYATAIQSSGKIVVAGLSNNGSNDDFALARYNTNGTLDTSFGTNGKVITPIGSGIDEAFSVAIQSDDRIIVSGLSHNGSAVHIAVARYGADGMLDTTFGCAAGSGCSGKVVTPVGSSSQGLSVAIQSDGKIVVAGLTSIGNYDMVVVRYNTNGTLDTTFGCAAGSGCSGIATVAVVSGNDDEAFSVAIQADGKIVLGGFTGSGASDDFALVRYLPNGTLDTTFDSDGKVTTAIGSANESIYSIAIQTDGKIVAAGVAVSSGNDFAVARYNSNGSLDTTFNSTGKVITPIGNASDILRSMKIQTDGKIVVAGYTDNGSNLDFALARYTTNGTSDISFGDFGKVVTPIGNSTDKANAVAIQTDGKIIAAGYTDTGLNNDFALVRYYADGSIAVQGSAYTPTSSTSAANGKIAFASNRTGNLEIFTMNPDGSNQTNISNNPGEDDEPAWSFDGTKIAFYSSRNGNNDIYTANADGSNQIRLTSDSGADEAPSFSPDGTKIVFTSYRTGGGDIYIMNADGSNQTRLTTAGALDYAPKFSPDGSKIVFWSRRSGESIFVMNADGSNQVNLTNGSDDEFPAFSPDGTKIAFIRGLPYDIYVMNANGTNLVNITNNPMRDVLPAWSSDGTKIVFDTDRNGNEEIYTMNADGSNPTRLTNNSANDYYPAWQPSSGSGIVPVVIAPVSNVNLTFANVTQAGSTVATPLTSNQLPALPSGFTLFGGSQIYDIRTSAVYTGNITVTFNVPNVADVATCNRLRVLHFENGAWTSNINGTPSYNAGTQVCTVTQTVTSLSPFVVTLSSIPGNIQFSSATYNVNENGTTVTVTVTRTGGSDGVVSVDYSTSNGTAAARQDYTTSSGTLNWADGDSGDKTFTVSISDDAVFEGNETVNLALTNPTGGASLGAPNSAVLAIADNETQPTISINDVSLSEGDSGTTNATFTVSLSNASAQTVTVNYAMSNGTASAGSDYTAASGILTFNAGETSKTVNVSVTGDTLVESNETFNVNLSSATNATIADSQGIGTITNDDAGGTIQFSNSAYSITEDGTSATITVTRTGGAASGVTVDYATSNGTATAGNDYTATSGTLSFDAGDTSKTFNVLITDDNEFEANETINLSLSNATGGASLGSPSTATLTITETDVCSYSIAPASQNFGFAGGNNSVSVTVINGCGWTAVSNAPWITVTGGASGNGNGTVNYSVSQNDNPARTGTITIGGQTFTVNQDAGCLDVSVPTGLTSLTGATLTVPVNVSNTTGRGIGSFDFTLTYDQGVLTPLATAYDVVGTLSAGYTITVNTNTSGQIIVSGFGTSDLTGSGTLINLKFTVTGGPSSCSGLNLSAFQFNEGSPCVVTSNGQSCVINGTISGNVKYANGTTQPNVPNVTLTAVGATTITGTTDTNGNYSITGFANGGYTVTPAKTGDENDSISAFDAALNAQHVAGIITLTANQQIAADASNNGTLSSFDSSLIARYVANIPNQGIAGTWKFIPPNRSYTNVAADKPNQNYDAILIGDVSGDWTPSSSFARTEKDDATKENTIGVTLPNMTVGQGASFDVPVNVQDTTGKGVIAYEFDLSYDPNVLQLQTTPVETAGTLSKDMSVTVNANTAGTIKVAVFGTMPTNGEGFLLKVKFNAIGKIGWSTPLTLQRFVFNENSPQSETTNGQITIAAPTAASAGVCGKITDQAGKPVSDIPVSIKSLQSGEEFTTITNLRGGYCFESVTLSADYMVQPVMMKKDYIFAPAYRSFTHTERREDTDFVTLPLQERQKSDNASSVQAETNLLFRDELQLFFKKLTAQRKMVVWRDNVLRVE